MVGTLLSAAITVIFFIISQVSEGHWKWGEDQTLEYTSAFFTGTDLSRVASFQGSRNVDVFMTEEASLVLGSFVPFLVNKHFCITMCQDSPARLLLVSFVREMEMKPVV